MQITGSYWTKSIKKTDEAGTDNLARNQFDISFSVNFLQAACHKNMQFVPISSTKDTDDNLV